MKLGEVVKLVNEKIDTCFLSKEEYVSTENMIPNFGGVQFATSIPLGKCTKFRDGDVLISNIRPYFKKVWFAKYNGGCSADVLVLRGSTIIEPRYLYYLIANEMFISYYNSSCKGTKMPRGNKDALLEYEIVLPMSQVQQHIVNTIGSVDDLIEKYEQIIASIKIVRAHLFLKYKSLATTDDEILNHVSLENGAQPSKEQHVYEKTDGYVRFVQNRDYDSDSHLTYIPISKKNHLCDEFDIMMDKYGDAGAVRYGIAGAFNVALLKIIPNETFEKEYIRDFLSQDEIKSILFASSQASTRPSLNETTFKGILIPMPAKELLKQYEEKASNLLLLEFEIKNKILKMKQVKQNLLLKYF